MQLGACLHQDDTCPIMVSHLPNFVIFSIDNWESFVFVMKNLTNLFIFLEKFIIVF
jgi:hypothetical protein